MTNKSKIIGLITLIILIVIVGYNLLNKQEIEEQNNEVVDNDEMIDDSAEDTQYYEDTRIDVKPSFWERIKNMKFIRTIRYLLKIKVVLELPALPEGKMEEQHQH
mgnify:CR=1 FL=1